VCVSVGGSGVVRSTCCSAKQ